MIPPSNLKISGHKPSERFLTTYSSDYKPFSERPLQVNQPKPEAKAAPASFTQLQTKRETWPIFYQFFYKTTNSTYGSSACLQPPSCHLFPASPSPFGILSPSISEVRTQEVRVAWETGHLLDEKEKDQLHPGHGGKVNVLEQQEENDELQQEIEDLCEKGMIVYSSLVNPAHCEDLLRSLCRETDLQHLLNLPVASGPIITNKDAENWDSSYLRGLTPATGLKNSAFLQPTSWQCSCCAWETRPNSCCFKVKTISLHIPQGSNLHLAPVPLTIYSTERSRKPLLTEYQSSYAAEWPQSKIRMSDFHHQRPPSHWNPHASL
ncbi:uncharacterized protein LOC113157704 [Anabas testudineus]|uniref:uncharacterized protein LOC113157704 n=1 Tax=Anabas testudineus TaxID=64144 RepID=UPI000E465AD8|nr:uncharacterized protein LOC113157704 [Anabas testudineus]